MKDKLIQIFFWAMSALLILYITYSFLPNSVQQVAIDKVTLREMAVKSQVHYLYIGDETSLTAEVTPSDAITAISWSSSDTSVAQVDASGRVTALGAGIADITASDPSGLTSSVTLEVIRKPVPNEDLPKLYYDRLLIANADNDLGADYEPELVAVPKKYPQNSYYSQMRLTPEALEAYKAFYAAAKRATGQSMYLNSSYRSYKRQKELYDEDVAAYMSRGYSLEKAKQLTEQSTQIPGHSEHQLGVSIDISLDGSLANFRRSRLYRWAVEHAHEYGFILRYPEDKTEITGIDHEWWHFRYVGVEHATFIYEHSLCLEEYVALQAFTASYIEEYAAEVSADEYMAWLGEQEQNLVG
ncbi:MAG: D-alanyl-D-alanine carboxypeptidase family protein [Clostridia bacterium]|nr:D-alanyl-D-alanine carboxypeptidase family protein [Clostridia bacterium]